jgi:hypothetical protein
MNKSFLKVPLSISGIACLLAACGPQAPVQIGVEVISGQPHLLSGGDALIEVSSSVASAAALSLILNDEPLQTVLTPVGEQGGMFQYRALIDGLVNGENILHVHSGTGAAQLSMVNYPRTGPISVLGS